MLPDVMKRLLVQEKYVHRDITSGNVLLKEAGHACLADFGLAHQLPTAESTVIGSALQADSVLMGTFGYMAPEYTVKTGMADRAKNLSSVIRHACWQGKQ